MTTPIEEPADDLSLFSHLDDALLRTFLKTVDSSQLSLVLKTCPAVLREKCLKNVPEPTVDIIREEMEFMGPVRLSDVGAAQKAFVEQYRRFREE